MGRFASCRCGSGSEPEFDSMGGFAGWSTGNGVCGGRWENTGNGGCASLCGWSCENTGNRVCGSRRERRGLWLWRGVVSLSLRDWWATGSPVAFGIGAVATLSGSEHWKQGVSAASSVVLHSRVLLRTCSGNVGGELA